MKIQHFPRNLYISPIFKTNLLIKGTNENSTFSPFSQKSIHFANFESKLAHQTTNESSTFPPFSQKSEATNETSTFSHLLIKPQMKTQHFPKNLYISTILKPNLLIKPEMKAQHFPKNLYISTILKANLLIKATNENSTFSQKSVHFDNFECKFAHQSHK